MKKFFLLIMLLIAMAGPAQALDITAPAAPDSAEELMPAQSGSFGEDLWYVFKSAVQTLQPEIAESCGICLAVIGVVMLTSLLRSFPGMSQSVTELSGTVAVATLLLSSTNAMIGAAVSTVQQLSDYGNLLLPVMTTAMAAQGGTTGSAALYTGTAIFDSLLGSIISAVLIPMIYVYLAVVTANSALEEDLLKKVQDFVKWLVTWCLKTILYIFTGYMSITGVVSGAADQAAVKAAKLTISGAVPVVGGIISDASEAILVSAGVVKSAAGVYGVVAMFAIAIGPFLNIGIHYLLLKWTAAICNVFANKKSAELIQGFSSAMGLLLGMTGAVCLLFLISMVCFLKGVG